MKPSASKKSFITLGIESSCDETGIGLYSSDQGLLSHRLLSQVDLHAEYGGVVPELASRDHIQRVLPLIRETLDESNIALEELSGIAYTAGPGCQELCVLEVLLPRALPGVWEFLL